MNKKLQQQIDAYYHENLGFIIGPTDTKEIVSTIAQHFYNLALEDVRKEVEDRMTGMSFAIKMELLDIGAFIENLTR